MDSDDASAHDVGIAQRVRAAIRGEVVGPPSTEDPQLEKVWQPTPGRIGICCSGGGIRSASYNLGALQALQDLGVLERATYLAAVSGGGYTAGAMTMLAASPDTELVWDPRMPRPFAPGSPEEGYLRRHSSYLADRLVGKVRLVSRLLLGMLLNLAVVGTIVVVAARLAGQLAVWVRPKLEIDPVTGEAVATSAAPDLSVVAVALAVTAAIAFGALVVTAGRRLPTRVHDGTVRLATGVLLGTALVAALFFALPWLIGAVRELANALAEGAHRLLQAVADLLTSGEAGDTASGDTGPTDAEPTDAVRGTDSMTTILAILGALGVPTLLGGALRTVAKEHASRLGLLAAWVVAPLLLGWAFLAVADDAAAAGASFTAGHAWWLAVPAGVFLVLYLASDLTAWSLHPFYKRRLSSAFALRRYWHDRDGRRAGPGERDLDHGRLLAEECDYDEVVKLSEMWPKGDDASWPQLVVCAAANVSDPGATPPGRNAMSFTFECDWVGGPEVGYLRTPRFEEALGSLRREDASLPAAMAISGAALSPSMGKMTVPSLRFLLALVNARLGVWLPNPWYVADCHRRFAEPIAFEAERQQRSDGGADPEEAVDDCAVEPRLSIGQPRITWLLREMLGWNRRKGRYLYVTDGGHWENLGLVELLRRGCTEIYCIDAAGDESDTFFTIGEAIALARSELGVEIELDPTPMRPAPAPACRDRCARDDDDGPDGDDGDGEAGAGAAGYAPVDSVEGTFTYPRRVLPDGTVHGPTTGRLVFVKAAVTEADSWDVRAYKERDPTFPNHSLLAQMFADQTFESYRALGYAAATRAVTTHH